MGGENTFTGIINNTNIGEETTPDTVLKSLDEAKVLSEKTSLPIVMTTVHEKIFSSLEGKIDNLYPLKLQEKIM